MVDKFFIKSKTILGIIILALAAFNVTIPVSNEEFAHVLDLAQALIGAALAIYGRFAAKVPLGFGLKK
jgi:hypothetical protein